MRITRSRHDSLIVRTKRSANALRFGERGGRRTVLNAGGRQRLPKRIAEQWIAIVQQEVLPDEEPIDGVGDLTSALQHPGAIRL